MKIFEQIENLKSHLKEIKKQGQKIGFVPTMGALHQGHVSLVQAAKKADNYVVCSIFVNPTQFNEAKDLEQYPRTFEADVALLKQNNCDVVFYPAVESIYPPEEKVQTFDFGYLENIMEGKHRPGHFRGVGLVVSKLLDIVEPNNLYMGQKDFQQCAIVQKLLELKNIQNKTELISCPIIREKSGLAMSSRNQLLSSAEKKQAQILSKTLFEAKTKIKILNPSELEKWAFEQINKENGVDVEYVEIVNSTNLKRLKTWKKNQTAAMCLAAKVGKVRLIDNILIDWLKDET